MSSFVSGSNDVMNEREWIRQYRLEQMRRTISTAYRDKWPAWRRETAACLECTAFELLIGVLLMANFGVVWMESDFTADCARQGEASTCVNSTLDIINTTLLVVYTLELLIRILVYRHDFVFSNWNLFDSIIVGASLLEYIARHSGVEMPPMQILRIFRVLRLARTVRIMELFPELYFMIKGFASAMKAMFWGFVLIAFTIVVWSIASVEFVRPHNDVVDHEGNEYCEEAFSTVVHAFLLFFQTLVAGDSWGTCIIPILQEAPGLLLIFVAALVCIQLGFTNLVLSVIVDAASSAREADRNLRQRLDRERQVEAKNRLIAQFRNMDADGTGVLSIDEFISGYERDDHLRELFKILKVDRSNISEVFALIDEDESGSVDLDEFADFVSKIQEEDTRVQMMILRFQSNAMFAKMSAMYDGLHAILGSEFTAPAQAKKDGISKLLAKRSSAAPNAVPSIGSPNAPVKQATSSSLEARFTSLTSSRDELLKRMSSMSRHGFGLAGLSPSSSRSKHHFNGDPGAGLADVAVVPRDQRSASPANRTTSPKGSAAALQAAASSAPDKPVLLAPAPAGAVDPNAVGSRTPGASSAGFAEGPVPAPAAMAELTTNPIGSASSLLKTWHAPLIREGKCSGHEHERSPFNFASLHEKVDARLAALSDQAVRLERIAASMQEKLSWKVLQQEAAVSNGSEVHGKRLADGGALSIVRAPFTGKVLASTTGEGDDACGCASSDCLTI